MHDSPMPALPSGLPWKASSYLLLDAISVEALPQKLYQWSESPIFEPLYLGTEWQELIDLSPCLIALNGPHDPILRAFLDNASQEWGYLAFTDAGFDETLRHLRWLLKVKAQEGETALLRLADPAVAHTLFTLGNTKLFGPIEWVCTPDSLEGIWHTHQRSGTPTEQDHSQLYRLNDKELDALSEVSFRQTIIALDKHLDAFFPAYKPSIQGRNRVRHMRDLAERAYRNGMCSEREILLFANVFGFLGDQPLESHPDLAHLLNETSSLSPGQRVEHAARLAEQRATETQGTLS
ncbi:DUF4123 domain-containing protein [Pseudomonas daroniae]|uniref:DUF4123 domain-containing protein n=1 Tax=Phytopseudomonas daroniae TaxID=2487519 RepID=A0A4Q9QHA4_9GAMM|nr:MULTISPECIES: DUF4123 domain-containing protein [Pseudomonas]TBU73816.1 DUF4123 domain-containing protein [Pseudomonas daroniae]TBU79567.1 DUF4123 domain-containing protein [Pseudomonas sp. FRB 228]TBU88260.1 DUF4123 domain-containing protein [Pseudomonas daroniae]